MMVQDVPLVDACFTADVTLSRQRPIVRLAHPLRDRERYARMPQRWMHKPSSIANKGGHGSSCTR
jgi:hypothetical protein